MQKGAIKLIRKILLWAGGYFLLLASSLYIIHLIEKGKTFHNWDTESCITIIPSNTRFDLLFMGTSHGRIFSRDHNHQRVEDILHKTMLNISKGNGEGGITPSLVFMKYFYANGNNASHIIYFIDPWVFYSAKWNEKCFFLTDEPFYPQVFKICLQEGVDKGVLFNYFQTKYGRTHLTEKPESRDSNTDALPGIDPEALRKRTESLYIEPFDSAVFAKYAGQLEEMVQMATTHRAKITFIFPATLLDDQRGKDKVIALLQNFKSKYGIDYYDLSATINDYHLYYNHDHLNTKGVVLFTEKYLTKICQ